MHSAQELTERVRLELPTVSKLLKQLASAGLIESFRGVNGGYRLARDPATISVADVIRAIDGPLANIAGVQPEDVDYQGSSAHLRETWVALRVAMRTVLEHVTLADVASGNLPPAATDMLAKPDAWVTRPLPGTGSRD